MEPLNAVSETLDTELKEWLRTGDAREAALLTKTCLAMRNNDGGRIILGVNDVTGRSVVPPEGLDVRVEYHVDRLNEIVGRYAVPKFEVRVDFKEYEGSIHPEIIIPGGISSPVISRSGFERELRQNAVYIRTISNGCPGSCEPMTAADWDRLIRICFDNREADVGRFIRRHLPDILTQLGAATVAGTSSRISLGQPALDFLEFGRKQLEARWAEKFESNS